MEMDRYARETRLPRGGKEFILFLVIISILSVNIIAPLIMAFKFGFTKDVYVETLKVIPFVWVCVIILVPFVVNPLVTKLYKSLLDRRTALMQSAVSILFSVTILSVLLQLSDLGLAWGKLAGSRFIRSFMTGHVTSLSHSGLNVDRSTSSQVCHEEIA